MQSSLASIAGGAGLQHMHTHMRVCPPPPPPPTHPLAFHTGPWSGSGTRRGDGVLQSLLQQLWSGGCLGLSRVQLGWAGAKPTYTRHKHKHMPVPAGLPYAPLSLPNLLLSLYTPSSSWRAFPRGRHQRKAAGASCGSGLRDPAWSQGSSPRWTREQTPSWCSARPRPTHRPQHLWSTCTQKWLLMNN